MDKLLSWFGEEQYQANLDRVRRFWAGEGRVIVSMTSDYASYRQNFKDEEILEKAVENLRDQTRLPGVNIPSFSPDLGTISTAKYWGRALALRFHRRAYLYRSGRRYAG